MTKFLLKITLITALCVTTFLAKAQIGYDYAQYDAGVAVGINQATVSDVQTANTTPSVHFSFNYNQTPFVNYVFEIQVGRLKGGSVETSSGRQFENHFTAFSFRGQLQAGELIDYTQSQLGNALKNLYLSTGIGYIANNIVVKTPDLNIPAGTVLPGDNHANEPFIPVRIGYEFKIFNNYNQPGFKIDLGYQCNFILGDNLDGYQTGLHKDMYSQYTIGVKFALGGVTSYRKQIHY